MRSIRQYNFSDEVIGLKDGKVLVQGDPNEVITTESISELYDVRLNVAEINGQKICPDSIRKKEMNMSKKSDPICVDGTWNLMSGTWNNWCSPSNPADGSILHGNSVLLCKGFKETS